MAENDPPIVESRLDRLERLLTEVLQNQRQQQTPLPPPNQSGGGVSHQLPEEQSAENLNNNQRNGFVLVPPVEELNIREFLKLKPPTFIGGMDPTRANAWLESIQKIFKVLRCSETQKVGLASYQLEGEAHHWWTMKEQSEPRMAWTRFLVVFREKYIPQSIQDAKCTEFQQLKQKGQMTVSEYEAEFTNLAQYAPHMVATENMKARKFEDGLKPEIRKVVRPMRLPTYAEVVDRALIVEQENEESKRIFENRKRQRFNDGKKSVGGNFKKQNTGSQAGRPNNGLPPCATCGRVHSGVCWMATGGCYNCGEVGHLKRDCPKLRPGMTNTRNAGPTFGQKQGQAAPGKKNESGPRQGKAFAFTPGDPRNTEEVVAGNVLICSVPAYVLIDSGSTHSFISPQLAIKMPKVAEPLGYDLLVSQPTSKGVVCTTVYRNCDVSFNDICLQANLIPLEINHFDAILGMDWLAANHATIDCANKSVEFQSPKQERIRFVGEGVTSLPYFVSATHAQRLLRKGCRAHNYLWNVVAVDDGDGLEAWISTGAICEHVQVEGDCC
ncbi:hypothetical protein Vadar_031889 [Vaccinium darrowii]|uniref:Uncharacterized protein n=1 Tax=Vaccinium darrowii TaxID=229202 RepID=A0ACB7XDL7_9ERIC|nr:hypothetical protein Vadar_031889 [Vaccinium darrowii]